MAPKQTNKAEKEWKKASSEITPLLNRLFQVAAVDVPPAKQLEQFKNIRAGLEALSKIQSQYAPKDEPSTRAPAKEFTEFTKWLRDGGVEGLDKIEFKADLEHGNGVVAREALKAEEKVLSIPQKFFITNQFGGDAGIAAFMVRVPLLASMPNFILPLKLIIESYDPQSFWKPYIDILPRNVPIPLNWTTEDVEMMKGSSTQSRIFRDLRTFVRAYVTIFNGIDNISPDPNAPPLPISPRQFTWNSFKWAMSIILSRQNNYTISVNPDDNTVKSGLCLIPGLDMFNHAPGPELKAQHDLSESKSEVYIDRDFQVGDEVTIVYGNRSNDQLLMYSGFIDPTRGVDDIGIPVLPPPNDKSPVALERTKLMQQLGFPTNSGVILQLCAPPYPGKSGALFVYVRMLVADEEGLKEMARVLEEEDGKGELQGEELDNKVNQWIKVKCEIAKRSYPSTLEQDAQLLSELPKGSVKWNIVYLRHAEKQFLNEAMEELAKPVVAEEQVEGAADKEPEAV